MKNLATLVGKTEAELQTTISKLEDLSGFPSEDARIVGANANRLKAKIEQLNLDPADTTGAELYHALLARYQNDCTAIDRALNISAETTLDQKFYKATELLNQSLSLHDVWVLKSTVTKRLLRILKPKKTMKLLGYRSLESMLKRQEPSMLIMVASEAESATWQKNFESKIFKLKSTDYELRTPKIMQPSTKFAGILPANQAVVNQFAGTVAFWPEGNIPTLSIALLLMEGLEQLGEVQNSQDLATAHPALLWWADAEDLVYDGDGTPISFNYKDAAINHLQANDLGSHTCQNGHQKFWASLMQAYKKYIDELPQEVAATQTKLTPTLALEPVEVYE